MWKLCECRHGYSTKKRSWNWRSNALQSSGHLCTALVIKQQEQQKDTKPPKRKQMYLPIPALQTRKPFQWISLAIGMRRTIPAFRLRRVMQCVYFMMFFPCTEANLKRPAARQYEKANNLPSRHQFSWISCWQCQEHRLLQPGHLAETELSFGQDLSTIEYYLVPVQSIVLLYNNRVFRDIFPAFFDAFFWVWMGGLRSFLGSAALPRKLLFGSLRGTCAGFRGVGFSSAGYRTHDETNTWEFWPSLRAESLGVGMCCNPLSMTSLTGMYYHVIMYQYHMYHVSSYTVSSCIFGLCLTWFAQLRLHVQESRRRCQLQASTWSSQCLV